MMSLASLHQNLDSCVRSFDYLIEVGGRVRVLIVRRRTVRMLRMLVDVFAFGVDLHLGSLLDGRIAIALEVLVKYKELQMLMNSPSTMDMTPVKFPGEFDDMVGFTLSSSSITNNRRAFAIKHHEHNAYSQF
ncbi:hypothetical protein AN958_00150 [Leucoagaricus sp. SymC.cos]|nr:hypothetical protein AN958_00150 [Leucoagaricus sp. SymC.cos]